VLIGGYAFRIRLIEEELASWLEDIGIEEVRVVTAFRTLFRAPSDLGPRMTWNTDPFDETTRRLFWEEISRLMEGRRSGFDRMRPVWEKAATEGFVPSRVPTADGPQPLHAIFTTQDRGKLAHFDDDGAVVVLSRPAAEAWIAAGAQTLDDVVAVAFDEQLGSPTPILDLFPELAAALEAGEAQGEIRATWVRGLQERAGLRRIQPTIARDASGLVLIDRCAFERLGWRDGIAVVLRALIGWGLLTGAADDLLAQATDHRVSQARRRVRDAGSMPERLLIAVGGSTQALLDTLSPATRRAVAPDLEPIRLAELALAVYGPTILSKVADTLAAESLDPLARWGGDVARTFVLETGFPLEFASSARVKREGEITVSGPIHLPPLHDYQEEILGGLSELFLSGAGRRRAVVSLPTGGGKTRVAAEAVVRLVLTGEDTEKRSALWIAQTDELCEQAVQCFRQLWVNIGMGGEELRVVRLWGGQAALPVPPEDDEAVVVVASIQTINNRFDVSRLDWLASPGVVIIDECHHAITKSYSALLRWLDVQTGGETAREVEPPVLGLSATPWRGHDEEESARLAARFDRRWFPADQHALYDRLRGMGVLARLEYRPIDYSKPIALSQTEIRHFDQFGELSEAVIERIAADPERNDLIVQALLSAKAESTLLFANSVAHAQYLAARLHLAGCPAAAVSGDTDRLARQHFVRRFRSGEIRVMCNHSVLTTGFDAPRADMILISRPVFSPVRYMQMVGRGLRGPANGGTEACTIVTVEDNILNYRDRLAYHYCRRFFDA
jgi:superfamily II DNA or RNA helicase